jgi:glycosyltransferase involved in cell wall biosynthesis
MNSTNRILFLYTEMAGYMLACMKKLASEKNVEVHVIMYPVNPVAPFTFSLDGKNMFYYERNKLNTADLLTIVEKISPSVIFCGGWIDKGYLEICAKFKDKIATVLTLDNPWRNTVKQNIAAIAGPLWLKKYFSHAWVAGGQQREYALKLGFKPQKIKEGVYSCDFDYFHGQYLEFREKKKAEFPKKILFVGRYTKLKGIKELWKAFIEFQENAPGDWELWCLGKGEYESEFPVHNKIKNFGFVQPKDMKQFVEKCGIFILPSHYEHWGVVVHEFAAAGFPLLCSTTTSAASRFLDDCKNGYFHEPSSVSSIRASIEKITSHNDAELSLMGDHSAQMGAAITPETWCNTALQFLEK